MDQEVFESRLDPPLRFTPPPDSPFKDAPSLRVRRSPTRANAAPFNDATVELQAVAAGDTLSASQKDLAARVIAAAWKIKKWCRELEQWAWTQSFEAPEDVNAVGHGAKDVEYWGCLPAATVETYDTHLDFVFGGLADLDMDDLKERILDIHQGLSRPSSSYSSMTISNITFYDDFSLHVTQVLLQTLPFYAELRRLLKAWSVRILVLRLVPLYLTQLDTLRLSLKIGNELLRAQAPVFESREERVAHEEARIDKQRVEIQRNIYQAGNTLDSMLDALEGHNDVLPDLWIDEFEAAEAGLTTWVLDAENRIFQLRVQGSPTSARSETRIRHHDDVAEAIKDVPGQTDTMPPQSTLTSDLGLDAGDFDRALVSAPNPELETATPQVDPDRGLANDVSLLLGTSNSTNRPGELAVGNRQSGSSFSEDHVQSASFDPSPIEPSGDEPSFYTEPSSPVEPVEQDATGTTTELNVPSTPPSKYDGHEEILNRESSVPSLPGYDDDFPSGAEESPSDRKRPLATGSPPPLNTKMKKRSQRGNVPPLETISLDKTPSNSPGNRSAGRSPAGSEQNAKSFLSPVSPIMPLEEQISNILEAIPTPIRFKAGPSANAPEIKRPKQRSGLSEEFRRSSTPSTARPALTLAPADESSHRRSGPSDAETRLYYLTQAGKDKPMKLYIRRVGENGERVMVRVGGGWADLGEYLRNYAEHHGYRSVSDGRHVELQMDTSGIASNLPGSRRSSLLGGYGPSTGTPGTSNTPASGRATPQPGGRVTPQLGGRVTPQISGRVTPQLGTDTPQSNASRKSSNWDEVGLAGPFIKRGDMSEEKKEWVDGIVEQAKRSMGKNTEVGDLGKTGTTRRIYFKGKGGPD